MTTARKVLATLAIPLSIGCMSIATKNYEWENELKERYREWFLSQTEYHRAIDQMCKAEKKEICVHARDLSDNFYCVDSPEQVVKEANDLRKTFRKDLQSMLPLKKTSRIGQEGDICEFDYILLVNPDTSVKDRERIFRSYFGLEQSFHTFSIAMTSSMEATARDKLLRTLEHRPLTYFSTDERLHNWNTRYLFWLGIIIGAAGGSYLLSSSVKIPVQAKITTPQQ